MSLALFGMVMDIVIVVLLIGTIYYAYALSKQLSAFRKNKAEFENLFMQLTRQINIANESVDHMQDAAESHGKVLDRLIHEGQILADELKIINDTSNSLADRLENAASSGRMPNAQPPVQKPAVEMDDDSAAGFAIRDREVETGSDTDVDIGFDDDDDDDMGNFHSQAERELYTALKRKG
ncbi:MAG: DUF6468 domain-containing protein [Alphaproteobacteria bacterium]|nr:DUF6468 domain-containing protein [Alphaproteobacteria bacterium]